MSLFISGFWQVVASGGVAGEETLSKGHVDGPGNTFCFLREVLLCLMCVQLWKDGSQAEG